LEYTVGEVNGVIPAATTIYATSATPGVTLKHSSVALPSIAGTTKRAVMICRLFRDATNIGDTYANDAFGVCFSLNYEVNSLGSQNRT